MCTHVSSHPSASAGDCAHSELDMCAPLHCLHVGVCHGACKCLLPSACDQEWGLLSP